MKNTYMEQINTNYKHKDWCNLNIFISNCIDELPAGKFKLTKKVADKLTTETIVRIACKHRSALDYLPEYKPNDIRALIIDWMKDGKLDREYKKPRPDMLVSLYNLMSSYSCPGHAMLLLNELGMTKQDFMKGFNHNRYNWFNMLGMASGFKFRPKDQDLKAMYKKYKDIKLLCTMSKYGDDDAKEILTANGNNSSWDQIRYLTKHINKFSDKVLFNALFKFHEEFNAAYGNNDDLARKITERLIKAEQPGLYTIIKGLYESRSWAQHKLNMNRWLAHLKDEDLEIVLALLPKERTYESILKYLHMKDEDIQAWNVK